MSRSLYSMLYRKFGKRISGKEKHGHILALEDEINSMIADFEGIENPKRKKASVVIIGAGFAGLSAAYHLVKRGFPVTVLEARDRVGGRVQSLHDLAKGQIIEGGGELIGTNHPLWVKLAKKFGFSFNVVTPDDLFSGARLHEPLQLGKFVIDSKKTEQLFDLMDEIFGELTKLSRPVNARHPWLSPDAEKLDKIPLSQWLDEQIAKLPIDKKDKEILRLGCELEFANNNAVQTSHQSLLAMLALVKGGRGKNYWTMTEVFRCSHGNDALAKALCKEIKAAGNKILLNTPVNEIVVDEKEAVTVTDHNGKVYKADYVILAVPPSAWSNIKLDKTVKKEYACQMGTAIKYLSVVEKRFWVSEGIAPSGLVDGLGMTWEGSDNQVYTDKKQVELTVFTGADEAKAILKMNPKARDKFYSAKLENTFKGYQSSLVATKFQAWPEEEWTKAGYSFPDVGEVCTKIKLLNEGYKNKMLFAGEHTCIAFVGYMEGALRSGLTAATKLLELEKIK